MASRPELRRMHDLRLRVAPSRDSPDDEAPYVRTCAVIPNASEADAGTYKLQHPLSER